MKKIYVSFCLLLTALSSSFAQVDNGGMESWRNNFAGFPFPITPIHAPSQWFGIDSIIVTIGPLAFMGSSGWKTNLFKSTSFKHSGTASAKTMSLMQDTSVGIVPGILVNAKPEVNITGGGGGGGLADILSFTGGQATTLRTQSVSAWVAYFGGMDTTAGVDTLNGPDTAMMLVQAYAEVFDPGSGTTIDSLIGVGMMPIMKSDTFYQISAPITYIDTYYTTDLVRITFVSGGGGMSGNTLDSSTLFVDDVDMYGTHQDPPPPPPVDNTGASNVKKTNVVSVYPNPATNTIYFDNKSTAALVCRIFTTEGRMMGVRSLTGNTAIDVSAYAAGNYLYVISDEKSNVLQSGKVNVTH